MTSIAVLFDRQVARCRLRPIARGAVTPTQGHIFYAVETFVAAAIVAQFPHAAECSFHAIPILALLSLYPLAKRVTDFPQVVLSIPLAWGISMSCSALGVDAFTAPTTVAGATLCFSASNMLWIIILDYVNACQDTKDDIKAGVRSMAVWYQITTAFIPVLSSLQLSLMIEAPPRIQPKSINGWLIFCHPHNYLACVRTHANPLSCDGGETFSTKATEFWKWWVDEKVVRSWVNLRFVTATRNPWWVRGRSVKGQLLITLSFLSSSFHFILFAIVHAIKPWKKSLLRVICYCSLQPSRRSTFEEAGTR